MAPVHVTEPVSPRLALPPATTVIIDSNVWIDILVFDDPVSRPIRHALETARLQAWIDTRCLGELSYVLDYPQFARFGLDKTHTLARLAALCEQISPPAPPAGVAPLPKCRDTDDQKFLELAHASGAQWLVSKDRALLKLARRVQRDFGFRIGVPAEFIAACALAPSPELQDIPTAS